MILVNGNFNTSHFNYLSNYMIRKIIATINIPFSFLEFYINLIFIFGSQFAILNQNLP